MKILFVDDELERLEHFIDDIEIAAKEQGKVIPKVEKIDNLEAAFKYISEHVSEIGVVVLDIMMPGGDKFYRKEEDPMGLRCGFYFYQAIRKLFPELNIRVFTNVDDPEIVNVISGDKNARLMLKDESLPFELTEEVLPFICI